MIAIVYHTIINILVWILLGILPTLHCGSIKANIYLIMPYSRNYNKDLSNVFFSTKAILRRDLSKTCPGYIINSKSKVIDRFTPKSVIDLFCDEIFPKQINTILYLKLNPEVQKTPDYILNIAEEFGYPIISWDPEFPGAQQEERESRVLQMAPTIYHQSVLMVELLKRYNWTDFTIVTTTSSQYLEFISSITSIVDKYNQAINQSRKLKLSFYEPIVLDIAPHFNDTTAKQEMEQQFLAKNNKDSRVYLLHTDTKDAKNFLEVVKSLKLTEKKYMWILSSFCVGRVPALANFYPLGSLAITYKDIDKDEYEMKLLRSTVKTAVALWMKGLEKIYPFANNYTISPTLTCEANRKMKRWKDGKELYKFMKNTPTVGHEKTALKFSSNGVNELQALRIINVQYASNKYGIKYHVFKKVGRWVPVTEGRTFRMTVEMDEITWPGNSAFPPRGKPDKRFFRIVTLKEDPYVKYMEVSAETGKCDVPSVPCRIMYHPELHGNDSTLVNNTVARCCAGLCIDLLTTLSEKMQFDYELYEVPDETWGVPDQKTGEWNGLIREISDEKADMVITSLKITPKRSGVIDFSVPFLETGITILVSIRKGNISPTAFLEPYDYPSWCLILVFSVHATGASIFIYEWLSPHGLDKGKTSKREHKFSLFRSFWMIWAMLFGASVSTDNPRGVSSRFLANVWALFALVFLASYTANLAAFMITKDDFHNLSGIKDFRLRNPYSVKPAFRFGTIPNGSTEENLRQNHKEMFKYMQRYNQSTVDVGLQNLKDGKLDAFIYDATPLEYHAGIDKDCMLKTVGETYAMTGYGIGIPRGRDYMEEINEIILEMQDTGELERLRKFWLAGACNRKQKVGKSSPNIGILNFTSAFILLAGGVIIGSLLLGIEHLYFKFGRRCLKKYDKSGCCELVSLSMGKSLTFEQSVLEAIDQHKRHRCKDPLCETQLWKVKHELDLSRLQTEKLKGQLMSYGIKPFEKAVNNIQIKQNVKKPNGCPNYIDCVIPDRYTYNTDDDDVFSEKDRHIRDEFIQSKWSRKSLRRSPSYTNAVAVDSESQYQAKNSDKHRYYDGRYYIGVSNDCCESEDCR